MASGDRGGQWGTRGMLERGGLLGEEEEEAEEEIEGLEEMDLESGEDL